MVFLMADRTPTTPEGIAQLEEWHKVLYALAAAVQRIRRTFETLEFMLHSEGGRRVKEAAPAMADAAGQALELTLLLSIAKLFDSEKMGQHQNLVLSNMIDKAGVAPGGSERAAIDAEIAKVAPFAKMIREKWRHKLGAHTDYDQAILLVQHWLDGDNNAHPGPKVEWSDLRQTVGSLSIIVDIVFKTQLPSKYAVWYGAQIGDEVAALNAMLKK